MKHTLTLVGLLFLCSFLKAQNVGDYRTRSSGSWNQNGVWQRWGGSSWNNTGTAPTLSDGVISIESGMTVTIPSGQTVNADQIIVTSTGQLTINGVLSLADGSGFDLSVDGTVLVSGSNANITFSTNAAIQLTGTSKYIHNSPFSASAISAKTTMGSLSNWIFQINSGSLSTETSLSGTYGNLKFENNTGSLWTPAMSGTNNFSCQDFIINSNIAVTNNFTGRLNVIGNFTVNGSISNGAGSQRFVFSGTNKSINSTSTLAAIYDSLIIASAAIIDVNVNMTGGFNSVFEVYGKLNTKTFTITGDVSGSSFKFYSNSTFVFGTGCIGCSVYNFSSAIAEDSVSYETTSQVANTTFLFWNNQILNLTINTAANLTTDFWSGSYFEIYGTFNVISGIVNHQNASINFFGQPLTGNLTNYNTTVASSMIFSGNVSGHSIPASATQMAYLTINNPSGVTLQSNLTIGYSLYLYQGNLNCGSNTLTISDTTVYAIYNGSASSYINGSLTRLTKPGTYTNVFYPVGSATVYQPVTFNSITSSSPTYLQVTPNQGTPTGTADNTTIIGSLSNRWWRLKTVGTNNITGVGTIKISAPGISPALSSSSNLCLSTNNSSLSYRSFGGSLSSGILSSTIPFTSTYITDLSSTDGTFVGIGTGAPASTFMYCIGPSASYLHPNYIYANAGNPYPTITAAVAALNTNAFSSSVTFEIQNDYVSTNETFPITITFAGNSNKQAYFQPRSDVPSIIYITGSVNSSNNTSGLFILDGADYISFIGGAGGNLNGSIRLGIRNMSTSGVNNFLIKNDATNLRLHLLQSEACNGGNGIYINSSGPSGNDAITISNNKLTSRSGQFPSAQVLVDGTATGTNATNDVVFINNQICNAYSGIYISSGINGSIYINSNSFFSDNGVTGTVMSYPIKVDAAGEITNLIINGNYIGGTAPSAGGSALNYVGVGQINLIDVTNLNYNSNTTIINNVISNITISNQDNPNFYVNMIRLIGPGSITENTFGSTNMLQSIRFLNSTLPSYANFSGIDCINYNPSQTTFLRGNLIQNVDFASGNTTAKFEGYKFNGDNFPRCIYNTCKIRNIISAAPLTFTGMKIVCTNSQYNYGDLYGNTIESVASTAPTNFIGFDVQMSPCSLQFNRVGTQLYSDDISIVGDDYFYGFLYRNTDQQFVTDGDTVTSVKVSGSGTYYTIPFSFEAVGSVAHQIKNLNVSGIVSSSSLTTTANGIPEQMAITGINYSLQGLSTSELKNCLIDGLVLGNTTASNCGIAGIYAVGNGRITGNKIQNLWNFTSNSGGMPVTIGIKNNAQVSIVANNFIAVYTPGINPQNIYGIYSSHTSGIQHYYFNSVSITGSTNTGGAKTYAIGLRNLSGTLLNIKNNIFQNRRSFTGSDYAIGNLSGLAISANSIDYNAYYTADPNSVGEYGAGMAYNLSGWKTVSIGDNNSQYVLVNFVDQTFDLHLDGTSNCSLQGAGTTITSISNMNTDIDNTTRNSPPTIGADETFFTCQVALSIKAFIQGYYQTNGRMPAVLNRAGITSDTSVCDTVVVELHYNYSPYPLYLIYNAVINTGGTISLSLPAAALNSSVYLVLKHRNALETWSSTPVAMTSVVNYDFTTAANKAYGSNQIQLAPGVFGLYSGDIGTKDGIINLTDLQTLQTGLQTLTAGYYPNDLTGDLVVESVDYSLLENNMSNTINVAKP